MSEVPERESFALLDSFQRPAGSDAANQRQLLRLAVAHLFLRRLRQLQNLDRSALVIPPADKAFLLKRRDVLVHRRERSQLQTFADFLKTGGVAVLGLECDQVVEHFFLSLGQGHSWGDLAFTVSSAVTRALRAANRPWHKVRRIEGERQAKKKRNVVFVSVLQMPATKQPDLGRMMATPLNPIGLYE